MSILRRKQHEGKHRNMHGPLQRIGEKEKMLLVVESALHLGRRTKFRGLQGIQLIDHLGMCYRKDYRKVKWNSQWK